MIVTAHQPNWLPGLSVTEKVNAADVVIWLDDVAFTRGGYTNRQRMPDGSWLTVPVRHATLDGPIRSVEIDYDRPWTAKHQRTLKQHYGSAADPYIAELDRRPRRLITLNLRLLLHLVPGPRWYLETQFGFDGGISERLARMVAAIDGDVYLSGPSGRHYLDEAPFAARGIEVRYWEWPHANPCSLEALSVVA